MCADVAQVARVDDDASVACVGRKKFRQLYCFLKDPQEWAKRKGFVDVPDPCTMPTEEMIKGIQVIQEKLPVGR
jgi:hypothetical protein